MNMYISNLSFNTGDTELNELFAKYGEVTSAKVITDRDTGRSRGFGFVEMPDTDAAQKAMEGLNNKEIEGRPMNISEARAKTVVEYLISKGISRSRLMAKGYGEAVPAAENTNADGTDNPEGRQLNRRTEFKVLKN